MVVDLRFILSLIDWLISLVIGIYFIIHQIFRTSAVFSQGSNLLYYGRTWAKK